MSQIIAGTYEIQEQIGEGGGGVVYLGRHLRLNKRIVLKADKRTLSTGGEELCREVKMLKNLSHMYIPQVYDFVQENGVVYTVIDFIEGESLDKLLKRGEIPGQPQVIHWACQLLEALQYLHSQSPYGILHGDIKPANIMLRPNGDICLIDFNIALALGEDGAVKVGFSRGYASPEHYGADYITRNRTSGGQTPGKKIYERRETDRTMLVEESGKWAADGTGLSGRSRSMSNSQNGVLLDVRSDIYSLGATLYHLISGKRPAQEASEVKPLGADVCSSAVSAIIQKAMAPRPDLRYQSAEEMRAAFLNLYRQDVRTVRHRRRIGLSAAALTMLFLLGGSSSFIGLKQLEQVQRALALSEYSANVLAEGKVSEAVELALQAIPTKKGILEAPVTAQAQKALTDALGVYDLSEGFRALDAVKLPSAPFKIAVSPEGGCFAVVYAYEAVVFDFETQQKIVTLPLQNSALSDVWFVDETHLIYAGEAGITCYDLNTRSVLWTGETATTLAVSADGTTVAAVNRDEDRAVIYRTADGEKIAERSFDGLHMAVAANDIFADPADDIFALNQDGSMLAVSFSNGGLIIFQLAELDGDIILYEESDFTHFEGGFHGKYFAFSAGTGGRAEFGLIDTEEAVYLGGYDSQAPILLKADETGIYLANGNLLVSLNPDTLEETELAYTNQAGITAFSVGSEFSLAATDDHCFSFYDSGANRISSKVCEENCEFLAVTDDYAVVGNRNEPSLQLLKLEAHEEAKLFSYDARYEHDEARVSRDGRTVMFFDYQKFRIYDMGGTLLTEVELPDAETIYDQQFRKGEEGSWLEVVWYDGRVRCYSAEDGSVLSDMEGEKPSKDLYEEFYTDRYRIVSSLHTAPEAYLLGTEKLAATLEEDSYLTYVTQVGEYIITEYISAEGERYGILLNSRLQKLAYLPNLCDIAGDMLVFDYKSGNLRQCRLYSLQELTALGETYLRNE